jgi:DNA-binding FadR family transcriptional regulator
MADAHGDEARQTRAEAERCWHHALADGTRNDLVIEICILTVAVGEPRIAH